METATNQWEDTQLTAPFDGLPGEIFTPTEIFVSQNITTNNISFLLTAIIMNPGNRLFGAQQIKKEILKVKDVAKVELSGIQNRTIEVDVAPMNTQRKNGVDAYQAIIESTVSRVRPVLMAAITTILGMIPLLFDVVSGGMAATIVFGLSFATLLTLFVTPALYSIFYQVKKTGT